jgi:NAD(P)-dependent dehydrogenase (short-subunit alcohol dehydrogenase family)
MDFVKPQAVVKPNPPGVADLTGKTIIITGGNQGLGFETTRQLLILKASTIILAVRTPSKGEGARDLLLADPAVKKGNPHASILIMKVDMSEYKSVIAFAETVKRDVPKLDVLLLNAGCGQLNFELAPTGHEKVTQVNYLSNALLSLKLLPFLEATAAKTGVPSRLIWVGSRAHYQSSFHKKRPLEPKKKILEHMDDKSKYSGMSVYSDTKLLVAMFVSALGKRILSDKVIINNMCPGAVNTQISDVLPFPLRQIMNVIKFMRGRTLEVGGWIIVNAAVVVGKESHRRLLLDKEVTE